MACGCNKNKASVTAQTANSTATSSVKTKGKKSMAKVAGKKTK